MDEEDKKHLRLFRDKNPDRRKILRKQKEFMDNLKRVMPDWLSYKWESLGGVKKIKEGMELVWVKIRMKKGGDLNGSQG